jgi:uncharacterized protein
MTTPEKKSAQDTTPPATLYVGRVMHQRLRPFGHRFTYRVFSMLIDIDRIGEAAAKNRFFSHNRFNLFSYFDRDHGVRHSGRSAEPGTSTGEQTLRAWVEGHLIAAGIDVEDHGPIRLLCFPRVLGFVFNPLSIYYCHDSDGRLSAILYEVHNTFGERHGYLFRIDSKETGSRLGRSALLSHSTDKNFHVSPFIGMTARYRFHLREPDDKLSILIRECDAEGDLLLAALNGKRMAFCDRNLVALFVSHPLMTLKVVGAIHWQALRLWWKGARYHSRPIKPADDVTLS